MVSAGMQVKPLFSDYPSPCPNQHWGRESEWLGLGRYILAAGAWRQCLSLFSLGYSTRLLLDINLPACCAWCRLTQRGQQGSSQLFCIYKTTADSPFCPLKVSTTRIPLFPIVSSAFFLFLFLFLFFFFSHFALSPVVVI